MVEELSKFPYQAQIPQVSVDAMAQPDRADPPVLTLTGRCCDLA